MIYGSWFDLDKIDIMKFTRSVERVCQEAVKCERRKLEWVLEEEKKQAGDKSAVA